MLSPAPRVVRADGSLADGRDAATFTVMSWNVLLPNSVRGWWVGKFYAPDVPRERTTWPRRRALIEARWAAEGADVVCVQEAVPESFADDFAFAGARGYDHALHGKGDLRCATFWRRDRFALAAPPLHRDRALVTSLRGAGGAGRVAHVVNVHLKAGAEPARRLRQVDDALAALARALRAAGAAARGAPVVVAGDFNAPPEGTAVAALLARERVDPGFREPRWPDAAVTSGGRAQPFGPLDDAYARAFAGAPPPTMYVPSRDAFFVDPATGALAAPADAALRALFRRFAGGAAALDRAGVDRWIATVNGAPGRGSEWDKAQAVFAARGEEALTEDDLVAVYAAELAEGKAWGVVHDLCAGGALAAAPPAAVVAARYDQIHYAAEALALVAVRDPLDDAARARVLTRGETLPNAWHPSDHLPVAAALRWRG